MRTEALVAVLGLINLIVWRMLSLNRIAQVTRRLKNCV